VIVIGCILPKSNGAFFGLEQSNHLGLLLQAFLRGISGVPTSSIKASIIGTPQALHLTGSY
jgi:hypothetical protein